MTTKIKIRSACLIACLLATALFASCGGGENNKNEGREQSRFETMNSGTITIYCEEGLYGMMSKPFELYAKDYPKVQFKTVCVSTREAFKVLLGGAARLIISSREYLKDEDSLMKVYKVPEHKKMIIARDGLVFFTNKSYQTDMFMKSSQIKDYFTKKDTKFSGIETYPENKLAEEPILAINNAQSSEYANFIKYVCGGLNPVKSLKLFQNSDSLISYVKSNKNVIGIGYLSQTAKDTNVHFISIGYTDSTGKYINPKPVHQAYIVQKKYPFIIPIYAYLLEDRQNLPYWVGMYFAKEGKIQKYFLDKGIVPEYAIIHGIPEQ
ncbi:MAG: hypothetical protein QG635_927 [Bacteroidota bacterium]|nr:hypothetical protein [Bacteroidota bacterium]